MNLSLAQRQTLSWLALAAVGCALLWLLGPVLTPFVVGAVMAYALRPLVERLAEWRVPRALAVVVIVALVILLTLSLLVLIAPVLSKELPLLREQVPVLADRLNRSFAPWLGQYGIHVSLDGESIKAFVFKYVDANLDDWVGRALSSVRIGGSIVLALVSNVVMVPVVLFYLLLDWPALVQRVRRLVPPRALGRADSFISECDHVLGQYLRGQLLVMALLAIYYSVGLALFGFELALPVGVFSGLAVFVPYLGFGLGLLLALLAGVLQFTSFYGVLVVAVVYGFGQLLEGFFLTPRLIGERIGLNPLTVLFALLAFGQLFGFVGVLVALPVSAVLAVAVRRVRELYLGSGLYCG